MALTFTYQPTSGYTTPVYPVFNDNTHILTGNTLTRNSFTVYSDVYINDSFAGTLKNYPFDNHIEVNPQKLGASNIQNDFNFDVNRAIDNPDAIKKINLVAKESYSRALNFSSVTSASTYVQLNFTSTHNLRSNDRIFIQKDNSLVNPQYNGYWKVIGISTNSVIIDCDYVYSQETETGIAWEGVEFFDYAYSAGELTLTTTNSHNYNDGDTIYLQMDSWATGIIKLTGGTTGSITGVYVNGVNIITSSVPFNTNLVTTAADLATKINTSITTPEYSAYNYAGDERVHIYSKRISGTTTAGYSLSATATGDITWINSPAMFITDGIDTYTDTGWNPHYTGTYQIKEVKSPTTFTVDLPYPFWNNPPGSERGSIYSPDNFISSTGYTGDTYYIMNNGNKYDYKDYITEIDNYVTLDSTSQFMSKRDGIIDYYSINEYYTSDILVSQSATTLPNYAILLTYSGTNYTYYQIDLRDIITGTTSTNNWERFSFGFGPKNLNDINPSFISPTPTGDIINDNVTEYYVLLSKNNLLSISAVSETLRFKKKCSNYKTPQIIFLNRWGSYDYFTIEGRVNEIRNYDRTTYEKKSERYYSDTDYGVRTDNKGFGVINNFETIGYQMFTQWLSESQADFIADLFSSVDVYIYFPSDDGAIYDVNFFPVIITDTEVTMFSDRSTLRSYEINLQKGLRKIKQTNQ